MIKQLFIYKIIICGHCDCPYNREESYPQLEFKKR